MTSLPQLPYGGSYWLQPDRHRGARWRSAVVIPARNEAERIVATLEALRCQWSLGGRCLVGDFVTVVVVNGTTDATCALVRQWHLANPLMDLVLVDVDFPHDLAHVGSARGLGMRIAAQLLEQRGTGARVLFSTDADSRLAPTALDETCRWIERGADAVGAFIRAGEPDPSRIGAVINAYRALSAGLRQRYYPCAFLRHAPHGDFGGAGFGVSLSAYRRVGGLPETSFDEDQGMRARLLDAGAHVIYPRSVIVYTSTRLDGRAVWGMAKQLAVWEEDFQAQRWPTAPRAQGIVWKYTLKSALREGRGPRGYFDATGTLDRVWTVAEAHTGEAFEARWRRFWGHPHTVALREARFPQLSLPEAYETLRQLNGRLQAQQRLVQTDLPSLAA